MTDLAIHYLSLRDQWLRLRALGAPNFNNVATVIPAMYGYWGGIAIGASLLVAEEHSDTQEFAKPVGLAEWAFSAYNSPYYAPWLYYGGAPVNDAGELDNDARGRRTAYRLAVAQELTAYAVSSAETRLMILRLMTEHISQLGSAFGLASIFLSLLTDPDIASSPEAQVFNNALLNTEKSPEGYVADAGTMVYNFAAHKSYIIGGNDVRTVMATIAAGRVPIEAAARATDEFEWHPDQVGYGYGYGGMVTAIGASALAEVADSGMAVAGAAVGMTAAGWEAACTNAVVGLTLATAALALTAAVLVIVVPGAAIVTGVMIAATITTTAALAVATVGWMAHTTLPPPSRVTYVPDVGTVGTVGGGASPGPSISWTEEPGDQGWGTPQGFTTPTPQDSPDPNSDTGDPAADGEDDGGGGE